MPQAAVTDAHEYGPSDKEAALQRRANSAASVVATRYIIWAGAALVPIFVTLAGFAGNRIITTLDQAVERQSVTSREVVEINARVKSIQDLNLANFKTVSDRIDEISHTLNDRQTAQAGWLQQLSAKFEELSKYVYTKVR